MIYEICKRAQKKDFYYNESQADINILQFSKKDYSETKRNLITLRDVQLLKELAEKESWRETDFNGKNMSYLELSTWLGSLVPTKFLPVTSRQFRHTISYLFDMDLKIYQEPDYEFFLHSQIYFKLTKEKLKDFNLDCLFLREIAEYIRYKYPKAIAKKQYDEYDWNWITQDFHLFVYREILRMDSQHKSLTFNKTPAAKNPFYETKALDVYIP
jgi:hypothetical protein